MVLQREVVGGIVTLTQATHVGYQDTSWFLRGLQHATGRKRRKKTLCIQMVPFSYHPPSA